jgi:thiol-disulfide isomerase/thioredoxin
MKRSPLYVVAALIAVLFVIRYFLSDLEGFQDADPSARSLLIFKAEWCGHCQKAMPEFKKLADASPISLPSGEKVTVRLLDADADKDEISGIGYKVRGYPTILVQKGKEFTEYPGERTHQAVMEFLQQA